MSRKYKQLSLSQRHLIEFLLKQGKTNRAIAKEIGVSPSAISREIKRNGSPIYGKYTAEQAQKRRDKKRENSNKKTIIENNPKIEKYIREKLKSGYKPGDDRKKRKNGKRGGIIERTTLHSLQRNHLWLYLSFLQRKERYGDNRLPKNKEEAKTQKDIEKEAERSYSGQSIY